MLTFLYQREEWFSEAGLAPPDTDMRLRRKDWYPLCQMSGKAQRRSDIELRHRRLEGLGQARRVYRRAEQGSAP